MLAHEKIDGLSVFAFDSGRPTLRASLLFNVGTVDETLQTTGWTHLLEHLAVHGWSDPRFTFNASVGLTETRFDLDGDPSAVVDHLNSLTNWLGEPVLDRWEHERKVLAAEAELRQVGNFALNLDWRFGPMGPGLPAYREVGLGTADPATLKHWVAANFHRANAALALDGPVPDGLLLRLPDGAARRRTLWREATVERPGGYRQHGGMLATGIVDRSFAAVMAARLLQGFLFDEFRQDQAAAYAPWTDYLPLTDRWAVMAAATDVAPGHEKASGRELLNLFDRLLVEGVPKDRLDDLRVHLRRSMDDPANAPARAWVAARAHITGDPDVEPAKARAAYDAVTPDDVRAVYHVMRSTMVMGLVAGAEQPPGVRMLGPDVPPRIRGRHAVYLGNGIGTLRVNAERIQIEGPGYRHGFAFSDVLGAVKHPDGRRHLITHLGWQLTVEPTLWSRGRSMIAFIDRQIAASADLAQPVRTADQIPKRAPWSTILANVSRRLLRHKTLAILTIAAMVVLAVEIPRDDGGFIVGFVMLVPLASRLADYFKRPT